MVLFQVYVDLYIVSANDRCMTLSYIRQWILYYLKTKN